MCLVIEQNEVCGAHISLKTGSDTPLMLKLTGAEPLSVLTGVLSPVLR